MRFQRERPVPTPPCEGGLRGFWSHEPAVVNEFTFFKETDAHDDPS